MKQRSGAMFAVVLVLAGWMIAGCTGPAPPDSQAAARDVHAQGDAQPQDLPLLQTWSGEFPVVRLDLLPAGQRQASVGYISDAKTFAAVWGAFQPQEPLPKINFRTELAVFSRNVHFYNRTAIVKVTLKEDTAEVIAMETLSALPIEDKVAMAMAVIPRSGVRFLAVGNERIPVR